MLMSKYGVARHVYVPIVKRAAVDFAVGADWTPAAGDVKISKDGGAAANVTNLPTAIAMGNTAMWDFSITATEMQAALVMITVADAATKVVEDQMIIIETYGHASAQHEFDLDTPTVIASSVASGGITSASIAASAIGASQLATGAITNAKFAAGAIDATAIAADAIGASELATDAVNEITAAVWALSLAEPGGVVSASSSTGLALAWLRAMARNKLTQTATTTTLRNDADSANIAQAPISDDGTTFTRGEWA